MGIKWVFTSFLIAKWMLWDLFVLILLILAFWFGLIGVELVLFVLLIMLVYLWRHVHFSCLSLIRAKKANICELLPLPNPNQPGNAIQPLRKAGQTNPLRLPNPRTTPNNLANPTNPLIIPAQNRTELLLTNRSHHILILTQIPQNIIKFLSHFYYLIFILS